jgi:hypothetical protein
MIVCHTPQFRFDPGSITVVAWAPPSNSSVDPIVISDSTKQVFFFADETRWIIAKLIDRLPVFNINLANCSMR